MRRSPTSLLGDAPAASSEPQSFGFKAPAYEEPPTPLTQLSLDHMRQIMAIDMAMAQELYSVGSAREFNGSLENVLELAQAEFRALSTEKLGDVNPNDAIKQLLLLERVCDADLEGNLLQILPYLKVLQPLLGGESDLAQAIAAALNNVEFDFAAGGGGAAAEDEGEAVPFDFDAALVAAVERLASARSEEDVKRLFNSHFPFARPVRNILERLLGAQAEEGLEPQKAGLQLLWYHGFGMLLSLGALSAAALPWVPQTSSVVLGFLATHGLVFNAVTLPIATIALASFAAYVLVEIVRQVRAQREVRRGEAKVEKTVLDILRERAHPLGQINAMMFMVGVLAAVFGSFFIVANAMTYLSALPMLAQGGIVIGAAFLASVAMTGLVAVVSHMKAPVQAPEQGGYQAVAGGGFEKGLGGSAGSRAPSPVIAVGLGGPGGGGGAAGFADGPGGEEVAEEEDLRSSSRSSGPASREGGAASGSDGEGASECAASHSASAGLGSE